VVKSRFLGGAASGRVAAGMGWSSSCYPLRMAEGSTDFLIPWACLMDREVFPNKKAFTMPGQRKTFAKALGNTCDIPLSQLPTPCIKGDMVVVQVDEATNTKCINKDYLFNAFLGLVAVIQNAMTFFKLTSFTNATICNSRILKSKCMIYECGYLNSRIVK